MLDFYKACSVSAFQPRRPFSPTTTTQVGAFLFALHSIPSVVPRATQNQSPFPFLGLGETNMHPSAIQAGSGGPSGMHGHNPCSAPSSGIRPIQLKSLISLIRPDPARFSNAQTNSVPLESSEPLGSPLGPVTIPEVSSETK